MNIIKSKLKLLRKDVSFTPETRSRVNQCDYVIELKTLARTCAFKDVNEALRDKFFMGIIDATVQRYFSKIKLYDISKKLNVITGQEVVIVGAIAVSVKIHETEPAVVLELIVIKSMNKFTPLLGRSWLERCFEDWRGVFQVNCNLLTNSEYSDNWIKQVKFDFKEVFEKSLSEPINTFKANIVLSNDATPIFFKLYTVLYGLREKNRN